MNRAFIFPGQGSQIVGMGKDFYDNFSTAKQTFEEVNDSLGFDLKKIIFEGPSDTLTLTQNTQPALMTVSIAITKVIIEQSGKKINELCNLIAGHSLGEYSALCASGVTSLSDTAQLLYLRGKSMQSACPPGTGAMAACLGIEKDKLLQILKECSTRENCQIANDNVEGQIVISGQYQNIDDMIEKLKSLGYKAIKLNVSAPFHSNLIANAVPPMKEALNNTDFSKPIIPIVANVTAEIETDPNKLKTNLINQICGSVRWRETMHKFGEYGINNLIEIGSGKVLSGLAKKSTVEFSTINISNISELENFLKII